LQEPWRAQQVRRRPRARQVKKVKRATTRRKQAEAESSNRAEAKTERNIGKTKANEDQKLPELQIKQ
jgi:hypothetical protein